MFPLKANDPYVKETGERSTLGSVVGGSGSIPTASPTTKGGVKIGAGLEMSGETLNAVQVPAHTISDAGKVLKVADDGSLEWDTSGAGGGEYALLYDFTKIGSATIHGVAYSQAGATFDGATDYIDLSDLFTSNFTIYVDVAQMQLPTSSSHQRFIMTTGDSGLIYRSNGYWGFYIGTDWVMSDISDSSFFDDSTVKIYIDSNKKWHLYKDGTEIFTSLNVTINGSKLSIGSASGDSIKNGVITGVRVYPGNYTE